MNCPECAAGKCGNCNGDTWDDDLDQPAVCACWCAGHPDAMVVCPWCPVRVFTGELITHMTDEHDRPPEPRPRGELRPLRDVDAEEADRESDRLDHINERHLP